MGMPDCCVSFSSLIWDVLFIRKVYRVMQFSEDTPMRKTANLLTRGIFAGTIAMAGFSLGFSTPAHANTTRVEDGAISVVYGGVWYTASSSQLSGGSGHESNTIGSTASYAFIGTGITWISYICSCEAGIANVYVDGKFAASVDTYAPTPKAQVPVFTVSNLTPGVHILTIEVTGQYDPRGESAYVMVDAFDVTQ
jgi:hypothetical protein